MRRVSTGHTDNSVPDSRNIAYSFLSCSWGVEEFGVEFAVF